MPYGDGGRLLVPCANQVTGHFLFLWECGRVPAPIAPACARPSPACARQHCPVRTVCGACAWGCGSCSTPAPAGWRGRLDVPVDAVQQRPADLAQVALDDAAGAAALAGRVTIESARPPVQVATATWSSNSECRTRGGVSLHLTAGFSAGLQGRWPTVNQRVLATRYRRCPASERGGTWPAARKRLSVRTLGKICGTRPQPLASNGQPCRA